MAEKESAAILANDVTALDICQREREVLMTRIQTIERSRQEAMIPLATVFGEKPADLTVSGLVHRLDSGVSQRLSSLADRLKRLMRTISGRQKTNHILIAHRLDMIQDTLNLLGRVNPSKGSYEPTGMISTEPSRGRIVSGNV